MIARPTPAYVVVWDGTPATSRYLALAEERRRDPRADERDARRAYSETVLQYSMSADRRDRAARALRTAAPTPPVHNPRLPGAPHAIPIRPTA